MNSKNQSSPVHDRGKPNRAKPDERRSVQTFEAQAQRRGVPGDAREWQSNQALETTPSTHAACGEEGSEWFWVTPDHAQRTRGSARGRVNSSSNQPQALDKPRHHTAKMVCVRRSRSETDALANSDARKQAQLKPADWVNTNRWMILMTRGQKISRGKRIVDDKAKKPEIRNTMMDVGPEHRDEY